jgi:hypothetical protein
MFGKNSVRELPPPSVTREYPRQQKSYETSNPVPLESFGETVRAPLGYIVAGRVYHNIHDIVLAAADIFLRAATKRAIAILASSFGNSAYSLSPHTIADHIPRHADEWDWLRSFFTIERMKQLLGPQEYSGNPIDRFEVPGIYAVHFLLHDHLEGYVSCL